MYDREHIEMKLEEGWFYEHHKSKIEPILHIHPSENKKNKQTLCFTVPIQTKQETLVKLKTWTVGSLYTLLHNESFWVKYTECHENDAQFVDTMKEEYDISCQIE